MTDDATDAADARRDATLCRMPATPPQKQASQATAFAPTRPEDVFGSLPAKGKPKSVEEMEAGIAAEAKRRHARGRY